MITRSSLGRSILTSIFTTALDFGTMIGLAQVVDYRLATFFGTLVGFLANFTINRYWAFEAHDRSLWLQFLRVLPVQAGSTGLQTLGVWAARGGLGLSLWISKLVVASLVYLCWNYPMNRFFVFGKAIKPVEPVVP